MAGRKPAPTYSGPWDFPAVTLEGWGEALADWRQKVGCTQRQLAAHLGVSHKTIEDWEGDRRFPSRPMRAKIEAAREVGQG